MLRRPSITLARQQLATSCRCLSGAAAVRPAAPTTTRTSNGSGGGRSSSARGGARVRSGGRGESSAGAWNPRVLSQGLDQFVVGQERAKKVLAVSVYNHYTRLRHVAATAPPQAVGHDEADLYSSSFGSLPHDATATLRPIARSHDKEPPPHTSARTEKAGKAWRDMHEDGILTLLPRTFDPSYTSPLLSSTPTPRKIAVVGSTVLDPTSVLAPLDPTSYDSPIPPLKSTRTSPTRSSSHVEMSDDSALVYEKSNVLLLGPTGSGKSLLARTLAKFLDVPFVAAEATGMTSAGYVGEDVENCVHRLLVAADWDAEAAETGIIFIDEVDKLARSSSASLSKDVGGEAVQQALLKILEGTVVSVPDKDGAKGRRPGPPKDHHLVDTTNILFILSGAFVGLEKIVSARLTRTKGSIGFTARLSPSTSSPNVPPAVLEGPALLNAVEPADLVRFGFIPEFIGRVPVIASLAALTEEDLLRVLTEPKNALVKQYCELFKSSGVTCRFTTAALREVAKSAVGKGTGARGLRSIMEHLLLDTMFLAPESSIRYVLIDAAVARGEIPARYYSRGQSSVFDSDFSTEEDIETIKPSHSDEGDSESESRGEGKRATG